MARLVVLFAVWLLLAGCAAPLTTPIKGTGEEVGPPAGWVDWCTRNPKDPDCISMQDWLKKSLQEISQGMQPQRYIP
jgi:hypothetical protein